MQKIFTDWPISIDETIEFYGDPHFLLGNGDCVDLWYEKECNGLGDEIIYGWAKINKVIEPNHYIAVRMPNL